MKLFSGTELFYVQLLIFVVISFVLFRFVWFIKNKDKSPSNYVLVAAMVCTLLGTILDSSTYFLEGQSELYMSCSSAICLLIITSLIGTYIYFSSYNKDCLAAKSFLIFTIISCGVLCLLNIAYIINPSLMLLYSLDSQDRNITITIIMSICLIVLNIVLTSFIKKYISKKLFFTWIFYVTFILLAAIAGAETGFYLCYVIVFIAVVLIYIFVINEYDLNQSKKQELILENHASEIVGQLQPEFLFNCLTSIIKDASDKLTKQSLQNFSEFLRYNINSITGEEVVSYNDELSHLRTYIALENTRLDNGVIIKYDLETLNFSVPKYVLQPLIRAIIQNTSLSRSITHLSPLNINISTKKRDKDVLATIQCDNIENIELCKEWRDISKIIHRFYNSDISKDVSENGKKMLLSALFLDTYKPIIDKTSLHSKENI